MQKYIKKIKTIFLFCSILFALSLISIISNAQSILNADGPGSTYELINNILAPGATSMETPDQCTSHPAFGRHIAEVWDATLNQFVFEFYIHVPPTTTVTATTADNDRCVAFDRQRVEIKTYEASPDSLKGTLGETVSYKWRFRLPIGFLPSPNFTHIHQIKAVGGDDDSPLFTLTPRYSSSGNTLQLIYVKDSTSGTTTYTTAPLTNFLGVWVEVTERILIGTNGTYSVNVTRVSDGATLLNYNNTNIQTIRSSNTFIRPKWGIYRSLTSPTYLRDDSLRIASISIYEGLPPTAPSNISPVATSATQIKVSWSDNSTNETAFYLERSLNGTSGWAAIATLATNTMTYNDANLTAATTYYYRVRAENYGGLSAYSNIGSTTTLVATPILFIPGNNGQIINIYPNPAHDFITIDIKGLLPSESEIILFNAIGHCVKSFKLKSNTTTISTKDLPKGLYHLRLLEKNIIKAKHTFSVI